MRLQYMTLPSEAVGDVVHTPFILIVDRLLPGEVENFNELGVSDSLKEQTGAKAVLIYQADVEVGESA